MAKLTITLEGQPGEDLRAELIKVLFPNGQTKVEAKTATIDWTPEDFTKFWGGLRDDAKKLLPVIASHAPTYQFEDLRTAVGMKGLEVAGRMSSIGHQQNRFPNRPAVVIRDWNARVYHIDKRIAGWIITLSKGGKLS